MKAFSKAMIALTCGKALILAAGLMLVVRASYADILYVSNYGGNSIHKIDLATGADLGDYARRGLNRPMGLALDKAGNLYVASYEGASLMKFTPDGLGSAFGNMVLDHPYGVAIDSGGNIYVANSGGCNILKFTPSGAGSVFTDLGPHRPAGLAFDGAGNLFATVPDNNTIMEFTPAGVGSLFASSGLDVPQSLAFDNWGTLYVANNRAHTIQKFTPDGVGSFFVNTDINGPLGVAVDSAGNVYSGSYSSATVEKFTPGGVESVLFRGNFMPSYLAVQHVPEPSAWMLLGLGLPVLLARRRTPRSPKPARHAYGPTVLPRPSFDVLR